MVPKAPLSENNTMWAFRIFIVRLVAFFLICQAGEAMTTGNLRCEVRTEPLGIDVAQPRLSWTLSSNTRGDAQTAYEVLAASSITLLNAGTGDLWDSGEVSSAQQNHVLYAGTALVSSQKVYWKVRVWDGTGTASGWSQTASWTMGILKASDWSPASWINGATDSTASTLFRKDFTVAPGLTRAVIHVCGLGQYEMSLNGAKVGNNFLSQGWTNWPVTCLYDTYDITALLQSGSNAVGLFLGNGFYNVNSTSSFGQRYNNGGVSYTTGPRKAIALIRLEYSNGTVQFIGTDASWQTVLGPVTYNSSYGGEDYDARMEQPGWNATGFNSSSWAAATLFAGTSGTLRGVSEAALPLTTHEVFQPVASHVISSGVVVYDFGQNAAQIPTLSVTGPAGSRVQITPGELLNTDGTVSQLSSSAQNTSNNPSVMNYTLKGSGTETFTPRFYYYGYRYLQLNYYDTNGTTTGTLPAFVGLSSSVISTSASEAGTFSTSNTLFNRIHTLIDWAQRSNEVSLFTDCPHREKLGWLEETYLNGPSLRYRRDVATIFYKAVDDMTEGQAGSGFVPSLVPRYKVYGGAFGDSPEWGSAIIQVPWQQYLEDGDLTLLKLKYNNMKNYLAYLTSQASGSILNYGLGDWYDLGPNPPGVAQLTPIAVTATMTYFSDAQIMAQVAALLGNNADVTTFTSLAAQIKAAFNSSYYNSASGSYSTSSQTANAMPLALGIVDPANIPAVVNALVQSVNAAQVRLTSGDIGYRYLLRALADNGRSDLIFAMNDQSTSPGYGYMLAQGATALTEAWTAEARSSQDHFMLGQLMEWFYHDLAGIGGDPTGPGYRKIIIKPTPVGDVSWVNSTYNSILGQVVSNWSMNGPTLTMTVGVPVGATATVYIPASNSTTVTESGVPASQAQGVTLLGTGSGTAIYQVASGNYVFSSTPPLPAPVNFGAVPGSSQVTLSWTGSPLATGYTVQRATASGGPYTTLASNVSNVSYTDTSISDGMTYYYVVTATSPAGSAASAEVSATPQLLVDGGFESPSISTYQYNPINTAWTFTAMSNGSGSGISANNSLFTSDNPIAPEGIQVAFLQATGTISQTINGLKPGTTYNLLFSAAQRGGYINGGQTWLITLDGSTVASFAPGTGAMTYTNYSASLTATAATQTLAFVGTDTNTGDNTVFIDNVRLVKKAGGLVPDGGFEVPVTGTFSYNPGGSPWSFSPQNGASGSGVTANGSIFTSNNPVAPEGVQVAFLQGTGTASQVLSGLTPGTAYSLLFSASQRKVYINGGQTWSVRLDGSTAATFAPGTGATAYTGYNAVLTATAATQTLAFLGTDTKTGDNTVFIDNVQLSPLGLPAPPALTAAAGNMEASLQWSAVPGAIGYHLKRSTSGGSYVTLPAIITGLNYPDVGLTNNTSYSYVVSAYDETGDGMNSAAANVTPVSPPVSSAESQPPCLSVAANGGSGWILNFTIPVSVPGHSYQLQYTDNLTSGTWQNYPNSIPQGGTGAAMLMSIPFDPTVTHHFFRILIGR
jgi:alpha-L-rhamnosidase